MKPPLSICFSTFGQPKMLARWFEAFMMQKTGWGDVEVMVVDDCGTPPAEVPQLPNVHLLRVKRNIPWNQPGARNLAVMEASSDRVLLIDPDMTFNTLDPHALSRFVTDAVALPPRTVLRPILRRITDQKFDSSSPNVHLLLRQDFLAVKGYDLGYCGRKGWSDVTLLKVFSLAYRVKQVDALWLWLHHGDPSIDDAQVKTLSRDHSSNRKLHERHREELRKLGWKRWVEKKHSAMVDFEWSRLR